MTQQKSTKERPGVKPVRFQGALNATQPSRFRGVLGNGFSAWLGQRWGLGGRRALTPVAKSFRQARNPVAFGRWPRSMPRAQANYAFFPTLSLMVLVRPMASLLPASALPPAPRRPNGAKLQSKHEFWNNYAFSPTLALVMSLRSRGSQFSSAAARLALERQPERRHTFTLPIPRERLGLFFHAPLSREAHEWSHGYERSQEQTWKAFLREAGALSTNIRVAHLFETLHSHVFAAPAAMLKLVEPPPPLFQVRERLVVPRGQGNRTIVAGVSAPGSYVIPHFAAAFDGVGATAPGRLFPAWLPRTSGLPVQFIRAANLRRNAAALPHVTHTWLVSLPTGLETHPARIPSQVNEEGPVSPTLVLVGNHSTRLANHLPASGRLAVNLAMAGAKTAPPAIAAATVAASLTYAAHTGDRERNAAAPPHVTHIWPASLPTRMATHPARIPSQVNEEGPVSPALVLVGNHSTRLVNHLPASGRLAVKLAMAGAKTAPPATAGAALTPPLTYAESLTAGEMTERGAASFNQMALHYQQRESLAARNLSETLSDLRQSLSDFKKAPAPALAPPDVNQLTRQVYDELKRELRIERERRGL